MTGLPIASEDGTEIVAYDFGGVGPPVLVAHATGFHAHAYEPLARRLARDRHVFGIDLRAHGAAGRPDSGGFSWGHFADDLLAANDALGLEAPIGIGHSLGGAAFMLAELACPGTFTRLYCYEPIVLSPATRLSRDSEQLAASARRRRSRFGSRAEALERYASRPPLNILDKAALAAYVEHGFVDLADGEVTLACDPEDEARTFEAAPTSGLYERLGELSCPVHLVYGEMTGEMTREGTTISAKLAQHSSLEVLPRVGHFGPLEDLDLIAESIIRATE